MTILPLLLACHLHPWPRGEACDCDGHGAALCERDGECGPCMCLAYEVDEPQASTVFTTGPDEALDWDAVNDALSEGPVAVLFAPGPWSGRLWVERTDTSEHRLYLWGNATGHRAIVPGIGTGYDGRVVSHVTVQGFDITGSDDKGVQWEAGDDVIIADNLVHDNEGSPAIYLDYSSRSGHASSGFRVHGNHVYDQRGECIYIGGSEGEDAASHEGIVITDNLVHDCWAAWSSQHDGINIKDRLGGVEVAGNVVFNTDWGIEASSPGLFQGNLVFATRRNGLHLTDAWGEGLGGAELVDNVVLDAGHAGVYINASEKRWEEVSFEGLTVVGAGGAGIEAGGSVSGHLEDILLADNAVGFDAWDPVDLELGTCHLHGNDLPDDRDWEGFGDDCSTGNPGLGDLSVPAGPDCVFFTDDDPWIAAR